MSALPSLRVPLIRPLLGGGRPPAVTGPVIAVVIRPAIQRLALWPITHVGEEVIEAQPAPAYRDAPAAIVGIRSVPRVETAAHHPVPRTVRAGMILRRAVIGNPGELPSRLLSGLLRNQLPRFAGVALALEGVCGARVVTGDVEARPAAPGVAGRYASAAASARARRVSLRDSLVMVPQVPAACARHISASAGAWLRDSQCVLPAVMPENELIARTRRLVAPAGA